MTPLQQAIHILEEDGDRAIAGLDASALSGREVLVTGASGLIGTGLLAALTSLRRRGLPITITAHTFSSPPPQLEAWREAGDLQLERSDLSDPATWPALPAADVVIHAAGYGQPGRFLEARVSALMLNTGVTGALLRKLRPGGRFLFFSSTEVYQGLQQPLLRENDIGTTGPEHVRSAYIEGKRAGEAFCHAARAEGFRATAIRLAHTYGPGTRPHDRRVINMFIEKALQQGEIAMQDEGLAVRTWGYLTDVVQLCLGILLSGQEAVYNVGGHSRVTVRELANVIAAICGVKVTAPTTAAGVPGAPLLVEPDLRRVEKEFGKKEYVSLEAGLERTIAYQRALYQHATRN